MKKVVAEQLQSIEQAFVVCSSLYCVKSRYKHLTKTPAAWMKQRLYILRNRDRKQVIYGTIVCTV